MGDQYRRLQWLKAELARWTYKPGFTFEVIPPERPAAPFFPDLYSWELSLRITAALPDSRRETASDPPVMEWDEVANEPRLRLERRLIPISQTVAVPYYLEASDDFRRWFSSVLMNFEHHEQREWLRRDGDLVDDPHAPRSARV